MLSLFAPAVLLSGLGESGAQLTAGTQLFAAYTGARELPIAVLLVVLLVMRSTRVLPAVMVLFASAHALDGADALVAGDAPKVAGSVVFAIAFLAAALWLFRQPARRGAD